MRPTGESLLLSHRSKINFELWDVCVRFLRYSNEPSRDLPDEVRPDGRRLTLRTALGNSEYLVEATLPAGVNLLASLETA